MPDSHTVVTLVESDGRTTMTLASRYESVEELDKVAEMGFEEGMSLALGQIEDILASIRS
jgi:uncharacterized protein YndB with AHSA1/START domain